MSRSRYYGRFPPSNQKTRCSASTPPPMGNRVTWTTILSPKDLSAPRLLPRHCIFTTRDGKVSHSFSKPVKVRILQFSTMGGFTIFASVFSLSLCISSSSERSKSRSSNSVQGRTPRDIQGHRPQRTSLPHPTLRGCIHQDQYQNPWASDPCSPHRHGPDL